MLLLSKNSWRALHDVSSHRLVTPEIWDKIEAVPDEDGSMRFIIANNKQPASLTPVDYSVEAISTLSKNAKNTPYFNVGMNWFLLVLPYGFVSP